MRRSTIHYIPVGRIDLPTDLAREVNDLLRDPLTGRKRYGDFRTLCVQLFSNWVEEQRSPRAGGDGPLPPL
jgi:hypothetical protein